MEIRLFIEEKKLHIFTRRQLNEKSTERVIRFKLNKINVVLVFDFIFENKAMKECNATIDT